MGIDFNPDFTIARLSPLIKARKVSPLELTRWILGRIELLQPELNAFITVTSRRALRQARKAQEEIASGAYRGPLHGIPVGLKDLIHVRGVPTTAGSKILRGFVPRENATVVDRLERAGAVLVGKTNLHEFAYGPTNVNPHYGPVRNPWDRSRMSGGSSGGSAAAVVSGMALAALGTDTGGSIRIPAALCGCVGLKPTYGRVSLQGIIPLASSLDHVGPLCRCVEDAALVLEQIAGADSRDPFSHGMRGEPFSHDLHKGLRRLRIGIPRQYFFDRVDRDVKRRVLDAIALLERGGAEVREIDLHRTRMTAALAGDITRAEALLYHWRWLQTRARDYGADVRSRLEGHGTVSALRYLQAQAERLSYAQDFEAALRSVHALAMPTVPVAAPRIGDTEVRTGRSREDARLALLRMTRPADLTGQPAVSVPCGFSSDGLPCGLQLIGRTNDEKTLLRIAYAFEERTPWQGQIPPQPGA